MAQSSKSENPARQDKARSPLTPVLVVAIVAALVVLAVWCWKAANHTSPPVASAPPSTNSVATNSAEAKPELQKLKGRWLRPDGGYIIEIKNIEANGTMEAHYFNPRSINVSKAVALREGDSTKIFIELRDVNYPGSTYTLMHDAKNDRLVGVYYQAAQQQSFEVEFVRETGG